MSMKKTMLSSAMHFSEELENGDGKGAKKVFVEI